MASWEKATCPLAALSLHYQPTKNSFHFSLSSLWRSFSPSICHHSWRHVPWIALSSEQVIQWERVRTCLLIPVQMILEARSLKKQKQKNKSILVTVLFRGVLDLWDLSEFTFCTDRSLTYHISLCAFVFFTLRVWKWKAEKKKLKASEAASLEQRLQRDIRTAFTVQEWPESQKHHAIKAKPSANELSVTR